MTPFSCLDCELGALGHPCRTDGVFDAEKLARIFQDNVLRIPDSAGGAHWSYSCVDEAVSKAPDAAWDFVEAMLPLLETGEEAGNFAAGPLEDLIADQGAAVIERIEAKADASPRFRYVLSGVWPRGEDREGEIWQRVCWAREPGPWMDSSDDLPPS